MPVCRVVGNPPRLRPCALDRPPYPPAQARAIAHASTSHSADPASCDAAQPPDPLPILQPSSAADTASMDDVSGDNAARDSPLAPANWSAYGTRNEDDRDRVQSARRGQGCLQLSSSCWTGPSGTKPKHTMSARQRVCITRSCGRST
jgi:hypothetical protein